jgi:Ankyrin repeats (3 copies)
MRLFRTDRMGNPIPWFQRKRPRRRHPHLPQLFYLVLNRDWDGVVHRARSHPHEICEQEDVTGNTALHIACRLDPTKEAVEALLNAGTIRNAEGAIALHIAATHRVSPEVIQVLLSKPNTLSPNKFLSSTSVLTRMGRAPIHYACGSFRGLSLPAFQLLFEATLQYGYIQTTSGTELEDLMEEDDDYDDNLNWDCKGKDYSFDTSFKYHVVTLRDVTGQTPMGLLFRRYRERVRVVIQAMERRRPLHPLAAALRVQADLGELWEKARLIVSRLSYEAKSSLKSQVVNCEIDLSSETVVSPAEQEIAHEAAKWAVERFVSSKMPFSTPKRRYLRIVHASVSLTGYGCPHEMIRLALSIYPDQIKEMDDDGCLPIHTWAMAPSLVHNEATRTDDDSSFLSEFSMLSHATQSTPNPFDRVLRILLHHFPAAVQVPHGITGKLPLTMALQRRTWDDGIQTLLDAYPSALESKKWFPDSIYSSILARIGNRASYRKSLSAIFELLKAKPDLLKS